MIIFLHNKSWVHSVEPFGIDCQFTYSWFPRYTSITLHSPAHSPCILYQVAFVWMITDQHNRMIYCFFDCWIVTEGTWLVLDKVRISNNCYCQSPLLQLFYNFSTVILLDEINLFDRKQIFLVLRWPQLLIFNTCLIDLPLL